MFPDPSFWAQHRAEKERKDKERKSESFTEFLKRSGGVIDERERTREHKAPEWAEPLDRF